MLKRKAWKKLEKWKKAGGKQALCIIGARQIGKTTLIREFCKKNYDNYIELNFLAEPEAKKIFAGSFSADRLLTEITAFTRQSYQKGKTVIFFDEIQACPEARTAIKFLVEDGRCDYIESGSLLGVRHKEVASYPVGFEDIYYMYPMDFQEFIGAAGVQQETMDYLERCCSEEVPVSDTVHQTMLRLFQLYIVVGGMPAVVQEYVNSHDIAEVVSKQQMILELYRQDIAKYAEEAKKPKIRAVFDSIPGQLDDKNRRFIITDINKTGRFNTYEDSFLWLDAAGVALPCYNVTAPQPPLVLNEKHNLFKLFMGDTGLLCAACMENIQFAILNGEVSVNMGSILENVFAQEIRAKNIRLHYFDSKKYGELDFVLQSGTKTDILEIKSGNDYKLHSSLNKVLGVDEWSFNQCCVFCRGNIERNEKICYLPWYMIMFYRAEEESRCPKKYTVDLTGLTGTERS